MHNVVIRYTLYKTDAIYIWGLNTRLRSNMGVYKIILNTITRL